MLNGDGAADPTPPCGAALTARTAEVRRALLHQRSDLWAGFESGSGRLPTEDGMGMGSARRSPVRLAIVSDFELVVAGVAAMLAAHRDRVVVVELSARPSLSTGVDVVLWDSCVQPVEDGLDLRWPGDERGLTRREAEMLDLIARGLSNQQIADAAYLSINSVKTHIRTAYRKRGLTRRSQAVGWVLQSGFVSKSRRHCGTTHAEPPNGHDRLHVS